VINHMNVRVRFPERELLEACDDISRLLEAAGELDLSPAMRHLLTTLDDAATEAYRRRRARARLGTAPAPVTP